MEVQEIRTPSGALGKNMRQAGHPIRTALLVTNRVSAALQPPRFAAGAVRRFAIWHSSFASGASGRAAPVACQYHVLISLPHPLAPFPLPAFATLTLVSVVTPLRGFVAHCGATFPVHPLPYNVRHPPVAPSRHIRFGLRSTPAVQPRSSRG